jgi:hypothetical protein
MAQSHQGVTLVSSHPGPAFDGSYAAIIHWQIADAASNTGSFLESLVLSGDITAVLAAWRSAERCLSDHLEVGPERARLKLQITHLRARYHHLFDAAADAR